MACSNARIFSATISELGGSWLESTPQLSIWLRSSITLESTAPSVEAVALFRASILSHSLSACSASFCRAMVLSKSLSLSPFRPCSSPSISSSRAKDAASFSLSSAMDAAPALFLARACPFCSSKEARRRESSSSFSPSPSSLILSLSISPSMRLILSCSLLTSRPAASAFLFRSGISEPFSSTSSRSILS